MLEHENVGFFDLLFCRFSTDRSWLRRQSFGLMDALFDIKVETTNLTHILRAVMGLYLGMVVFWLWGAFNSSMTRPALGACAVFMLGLAAGRILSFIVDGWPHWLLVVYAILEIVLGWIAVALYKKHKSKDVTTSL